MANKINIVITAEDKAKGPIRAVGDELDTTSAKTKRFDGALASLGGTVKSTTLALGATGLAAAGAGVAIGFDFNSQVEQARTKLMAFMKDGEKVAKTLDWVKQEAAATQFSFTDMADAAANLTPVAKSSGVALEDLIRQAEILAAINPTEGLTGATFSLREALSGDWVSIVDRFNLPRKRINELKEQGVPAMEIITRTLQEMGIEYNLVADQGKTVSARWDQIVDKLKMMAGQAGKPLFDRVSNELDNLGKFDYTGLGDKLAGVFSGAIAWADEMTPKVMAVGKQVGDYLGPKFGDLGRVLTENVMPVLGRLWHEVLEPLMPVLGETLVGVIGFAVDAFKNFLSISSDVLNFLLDNKWIIWAAVDAFIAFKAAMVIRDTVSAFQEAMAAAAGPGGVGLLQGKFDSLKGALTSPIVLPALGVTAVMLGLQLIIDKTNETIRTLQSLGSQIDKNRREGAATDAAIKKGVDEGRISQEKYQEYIRNTGRVAERTANDMRHTYDGFFGPLNRSFDNLFARLSGAKEQFKGTGFGGFATGTNAAPGDWRIVGEHGPEPMYVPQGAQMTPAYRARQGAPAGGGGPVINMNGPININNGSDYKSMLSDIGFALRLAS